MLYSETLLELRKVKVQLHDAYTPNKAPRHTENEGIKKDKDNARQMPTNKKTNEKILRLHQENFKEKH